MCIAADQGQTTPRGQNFDVNRNALSLRSFATRFKKISLKSEFIHFFMRDKVLMSTETSCHNPLFYFFPIQKRKGPNLTLP